MSLVGTIIAIPQTRIIHSLCTGENSGVRPPPVAPPVDKKNVLMKEGGRDSESKRIPHKRRVVLRKVISWWGAVKAVGGHLHLFFFFYV